MCIDSFKLIYRVHYVTLLIRDQLIVSNGIYLDDGKISNGVIIGDFFGYCKKLKFSFFNESEKLIYLGLFYCLNSM